MKSDLDSEAFHVVFVSDSSLCPIPRYGSTVGRAIGRQSRSRGFKPHLSICRHCRLASLFKLTITDVSCKNRQIDCKISNSANSVESQKIRHAINYEYEGLYSICLLYMSN